MTDPQQPNCDDIDFATVASDAGHAEIGKQLTPEQCDELDQLLTSGLQRAPRMHRSG